MFRLLKIILIVTSGLIVAKTSFAHDYLLERQADMKLDLREHIGKTFLQTLLTPNVGIDIEIDNEAYEKVRIKHPKIIADFAEKHFDERVTQRLYRFFKDGRVGFEETIDKFWDSEVVPAQFKEQVRPIASQLAKDEGFAGRATGASSALALLVSGSGTLIVLDDKNYFYNVGYQDPNVTTGRSFTVSGNRKMLDATHRDYLKDLKKALEQPNSTELYQVLLQILTQSDTRGVKLLSPQAQIVISDFLTVYAAELERHEMLDLGLSSPWEIDFAQVTLLADYTQASNMVMKDDKFVQGDVEDYILGSIGNTKKQFTSLSKMITTFLSQPNYEAKLIDRITELTPISDVTLAREVQGDIFRRILYFLNNRDTSDLASENAQELIPLIVNLVSKIRENETKITENIKGCYEGTVRFSCRGMIRQN
jgi:hypothetical protein